jgi:hypothetical protein
MELAAACLNCRYWREVDESEYGRCHRYAPHPYVKEVNVNANNDDESLLDVTHWPEVHFSDWCGEMSFGVKPEPLPL